MGDRANIVVKQSDGTGVWLYTHWHGSEMPKTLQAAMKRGKDRWDDTPYLARIIFCEMVKGNAMDLAGFGITTSMTDNEYPVLTVDPDNLRVSIDQAPDRQRDTPCIGKVFTFEEFCAVPNMGWQALNRA